MTGFESPDRKRFTALFTSAMSFPEREQSPHVLGVGRTAPSFLRYLYKAMIHFSHVYTASTDMRAWVLRITSCVRI